MTKKKNPYRTAQNAGGNPGSWVAARDGRPVEDMPGLFRGREGRLTASADPMVGANGELNAYNKADLMAAIGGLLARAQSGEIVQNRATTREQVEARAELLRSALADRTGEQFALMGEELSDMVYDHVRREGFIRKVLQETELVAGQTARVRLRQMGAIVMGSVEGSAAFKPFLVTTAERYTYPPEYYVKASILVEDKEIAQVPGDLLTEKLEDAQEQIQVQEDTVLKRMLDLAVGSSGQQVLFSTFTPAFFSTLRQFLQNRGIPASTALIASDLWDDIIGNTTFSNWFDPVTKHELVLTGVLGSILNVTLITDAFVEHQLRVLSPGEVYFLGLPKTLGKLFIRQPLQSQPINQYNISRPARGWFLSSIQGCAIANISAVARGRKV